MIRCGRSVSALSIMDRVPNARGGSVKRKFVAPVLREEAHLSVLTLGINCSNCDGR